MLISVLLNCFNRQDLGMKVIIGSKTGQLCNRLFAFSHFIVNAIDYGYDLHNPNFDEYCSYFQATAKNCFGKYPITIKDESLNYLRRRKIGDRVPLGAYRFYFSSNHRLLVSRKLYDLRSPQFRELLKTNKVIVTYGWLFRDYEGFKQHSPLLKRFFEPIEEHSQKVKALIESIQQPNKVLVGVHIRRGDYQSFAKGQYYYDDAVYSSKMLQIKKILNEQGKEVFFLLCSNEPINHPFKGMEVHLGTGHLIEDLYSLAACDYLIGPPSTYSSWASFYGNVPLLHIKSPEQVISLADFEISQG